MNRLEWMAVGWGGTVVGLGVIVISTGEGLARFVAMAVLCLVAGFLAGVRAEDRRVLHSAMAAIAGAVFWVVFVTITTVVALFGGPDGASWDIGGESPVLNLVVAFVLSIVGGVIAAYRLRPQGGGRRARD